MSQLICAGRPRLRMLFVATSLAILCAVAGCTQLPVREFTAYREAFTSARASGEKVLLDYDATKTKRAAIEKAAAAAQPAGYPTVGRPVWTVVAATKSAEAADAIVVRLAAWKIVADYNEMLLGLVEGKSATELGASLGSLSKELSAFPWGKLSADIAKMAGSVGGVAGPAVEVVTRLAVEFRREQDRKAFLDAVAKASPLIDSFIALLKEDLGDFAATRAYLYDFERSRTLLAMANKLGEFGVAAADLEAAHAGLGDIDRAGEVAQQRSAVDAAARKLREYEADGIGRFVSNGAVADLVAQQKRLDSLATDVAQLIAVAQAQDREMDAYESLLDTYLKLLDQLIASTHLLRDAVLAAAKSPELPPTETIMAFATEVRRAIETYEKAR